MLLNSPILKSRKLSEVTLGSPRGSFSITSIKKCLKLSIKAAGVACSPTLEGVACGLTLEDAASRIPSSFVAYGPIACEDKGVTSLGIPKVTSLDRRLFEVAIRVLDRSAGFFLEIVFFFPKGETIGMFKHFKGLPRIFKRTLFSEIV
jgi:hypothetical protein